MSLSIKSGWGMQAATFAVTSVVAGANAVLGNVGVCIAILAGSSPIRLTKLSYRVDLAPDVPAGTASSPVRWRVFAVAGVTPQDVSAFQAQAYPTGSHPEIPLNTAAGSPLPMLYDAWLDFAAGDNGLNKLASVEFPDAGPTVNPGEYLNVIIVPIIDAQLDQSTIAASNATCVLIANGTAISGADRGVGGNDTSRSLPRYDTKG